MPEEEFHTASSVEVPVPVTGFVSLVWKVLVTHDVEAKVFEAYANVGKVPEEYPNVSKVLVAYANDGKVPVAYA